MESLPMEILVMIFDMCPNKTVLMRVNHEIRNIIRRHCKCRLVGSQLYCGKVGKEGQLNILKWARLNDAKFDINTWIYIAVGGDLACLKYIHKCSGFIPANICDCIVKGGNIECIKYIHGCGIKWSPRSCENAIKIGNLEILKYIHKTGGAIRYEFYINSRSLRCFRLPKIYL